MREKKNLRIFSKEAIIVIKIKSILKSTNEIEKALTNVRSHIQQRLLNKTKISSNKWNGIIQKNENVRWILECLQAYKQAKLHQGPICHYTFLNILFKTWKQH